LTKSIPPLSDPEPYESYRDNLISYTKVMADRKFKVSSYVDAVRYVSHKLMGSTNGLLKTKLRDMGKVTDEVVRGACPLE
jgi:hypothetical protein